MRSEGARKLLRGIVVGALLLGNASCGLFGKKSDLNRLLNFNPDGVGCMNEIGAHFKAYYQGTMDAQTWGATWDCATNNLGLFKKFVRSSDPAGFTRDDIQAFVSQLLITNQTITPELIGALFELKASLFGGSRDIIAPSEFDAVVAFLGVLKAETTRLLPYMVKRVAEPTPDNLLALTDALVALGENIAAALHTQGNPTFSFVSAQNFAEQLVRILHVDMPPDLVAWLSAVKVVLTAGASDGIAAGDWPRIMRAIVAYGGPALAVFSVDSKYLKGPNAIGQFGMQLAWKVKTSLLQTLDLYGGALPLTALDSVIDSLPPSWFAIDRAAIKGALRPLANKMLMSRVPNAIDGSAVDLVFEKLSYWSQEQTHLETIFEMLNPGANGVTFEAFDAAAQKYIETLPANQAPGVYHLIALARDTRPLFLGNDDQITFTPNTMYSLHDLSNFNWITIAADHVLQAYGSVPGGKLGTVEDFKTLVADYTGLVRAFHASDLSVPNWATARFLEGNLFTYASNGDDYLDHDEVVYLIAMAFSAGAMSKKIREGTDLACPAVGQDVLGHNWKTAECVRRELFGNYRSYWDHQPLLVQYYQNLSPSDQYALQQAMEKSGRRYGISEQPVASSDQDGFAGITQYVEALLSRFDLNNDQTLSRSEADHAYPVFKAPLTDLGGLKGQPDWIVNSVFTYVLNYGHPPSKDVGGIASLALWIAWTKINPWWTLSADRLKLYEVIASIKPPEALPGTTPHSAAETRTIPELSQAFGIPLDGTLPAMFTAPVSIPAGM